ncbi:DUF222 domain-containing protein, partial [Mycobacterium sp.]|uniref:DUF222 domain-containing protein n=1 Tax=Mycobacterium sp. TaxID=1785 RepID=UPI0025EC52A4
MSSIQVVAPPEVVAAFEALDDAVAAVGALDWAAYDPAVRLRALARLETARRRQSVTGHDLIAGLACEDRADIGGPVPKVVADWLRISCGDARRRLRDARQLASPITLTGHDCHY